MKNVLIASLLFFVCAISGQADDEAMRKNMKTQAQQLAKAMVKNDHATVADLTHAKVVETIGGKKKMIQLLEDVAQKIETLFPTRTVEVHEPTALEQAKEEWYGITPFSLQMKGPQGSVKMRSFLVGVSTDKGRTWTFIDGNQANSLAKVRSVLPNYPEKLALPKVEAPQFEKAK